MKRKILTPENYTKNDQTLNPHKKNLLGRKKKRKLFFISTFRPRCTHPAFILNI